MNAKVVEIYDKVVEFQTTNKEYVIPQKVAKLDVGKDELIEVVIYTQYPNPNHPYTYDNVVPHNDWIEVGMTVELRESWDGYFVCQ